MSTIIYHTHTTKGFKESLPPFWLGYHHTKIPALIEYTKKGNINKMQWFIQNKTHRENKPAGLLFKKGYITYKAYLLNGIWHNENGPSRIWYTKKGNIKNQGWYLNNKYISTSYNGFCIYLKEYEPELYNSLLKRKSTHIFD